MAPALSFQKVHELTDHLRREAIRLGMHPLALVVIDSDGQTHANAQMGNIGTLGFDIATNKARAALEAGRDTMLVPKKQPGGVLLYSGDVVVGAIGVYYDNSQKDHDLAASRPKGWTL